MKPLVGGAEVETDDGHGAFAACGRRSIGELACKGSRAEPARPGSIRLAVIPAQAGIQRRYRFIERRERALKLPALSPCRALPSLDPGLRRDDELRQ